MSQTLSQRAAEIALQQMPQHERLESEEYRIAAKEWVKLDGEARLLEEMKSSELAKRMKALGEMPIAKAEREVRASEDWIAWVTNMVNARTAANMGKVRMKWIELKYMEGQARSATERVERRMSR